jgi:hypothetical protein
MVVPYVYGKGNYLMEARMTEYQISMCGLDCQTCAWREPNNCGGCKETNGEPFHGTCRLASCVKNKGFEDCSYCPEFPCSLLVEFSYDKEHGENGGRIKILTSLREARG